MGLRNGSENSRAGGRARTKDRSLYALFLHSYFLILGLLFSSYLPRTFNTRLFLILAAAFIVATVIGTLSHEGGHYFIAKGFGYHPRIHYASCSFGDNEVIDSLEAIYQKHQKELEEGLPFPGKEKYEELQQGAIRNELWILIGGPLQTILTGTIGLILLFAYRKSFAAKQALSSRQWALVFITLFWLRQTANLAMWLIDYLVSGEFSSRSDEIGIALELEIPFWSLTAITGIIGMAVLVIVLLKFVPPKQRLTFVASGIAGGVTGYILWLHLLGPVLLP